MDFATSAMAVDPWTQTLGLLAQLSGSSDARVVAPLCETQRGCVSGNVAHQRPVSVVRRSGLVNFIDRPTATTVTIAWRDSTHCSYGDQLWQASRAKVNGVCAMSGHPIRPGDAVYQPRPEHPKPLNADAMILASALQEMEED
ncbi:DUF3331 domain-containing protein [Burkholderia pyrrocinia]|uniref:DUF3331 domain-containing protein n=1 Tax=Burkholderia pyrrocinia TaxID=60550 RepID=UPI0030D613F2